jgi:hypothetical protein
MFVRGSDDRHQRGSGDHRSKNDDAPQRQDRENASISVTAATEHSEHSEHRGTPDFIPCRQSRKLQFDEVEFVLNPIEVAAYLIGLAQR